MICRSRLTPWRPCASSNSDCTSCHGLDRLFSSARVGPPTHTPAPTLAGAVELLLTAISFATHTHDPTFSSHALSYTTRTQGSNPRSTQHVIAKRGGERRRLPNRHQVRLNMGRPASCRIPSQKVPRAVDGQTGGLQRKFEALFWKNRVVESKQQGKLRRRPRTGYIKCEVGARLEATRPCSSGRPPGPPAGHVDGHPLWARAIDMAENSCVSQPGSDTFRCPDGSSHLHAATLLNDVYTTHDRCSSSMLMSEAKRMKTVDICLKTF